MGRARSTEYAETDSDQAFSRVREEGTGGVPRADVRLSRYAVTVLDEPRGEAA